MPNHLAENIRFVSTEETTLTWQQLADRGLLQLREVISSDTGMPRFVVDIPMIAIVTAAAQATVTYLQGAEKAFVILLKFIISLPKEDLEDWQKWE